ncbi:hypothetical protein [Amycolatopsis australiensis]|uniref:Uncharacterized protein n=1 Tax=Amycolatopsis australiensis TaxID=546364 RepID=A0A1K1LS37_9PSEU|nr:hypothetical protein [Amycolatopsis australiensis]SFW13682.1 hypothetical protein SAMN04489730_0180 [Amycolatopsis australiensis]
MNPNAPLPPAREPGATRPVVTYTPAKSADGQVAAPVPTHFDLDDVIDIAARVAARLKALPTCRSGCPADHAPTVTCTYQGPATPPIRMVS